MPKKNEPKRDEARVLNQTGRLKLKAALDDRGWSQRIAEKKVKITQSMISRICSGGRPVAEHFIQDLCESVGFNDWTDYLLPVSSLQFSAYDPETFAGRAAETAHLTALLKGHCRVLAITGVTGIGKTTLVERVVANLMEAVENTLPYYRFSLDLPNISDFSRGGMALLGTLGKKISDEEGKEYHKNPEKLVSVLIERLDEQPCRLQIDSLECLFKSNAPDSWGDFSDSLWLDFLHQFLAGNQRSSQLLLTTQHIPSDLEFFANRYPNFWHCQTLQGLSSAAEQKELFYKQGLPRTKDSLTILFRLADFFGGHPYALRLIAAEIKEEFSNSVTDYWSANQADFTVDPAPTNNPLTSSKVFNVRVKRQVERTISRLPEPARQMLCASAVFRRPVPVTFWLAMHTNNSGMIFDILHRRHLVADEPASNRTVQVYQHNLVHSVAYDLLKADLATWHSAERQAAYLWLNAYEPPKAPNLETVRGYLEAFEHYCNVEDWDLASEIYNCQLASTNKALNWQLWIWGYYKELLKVSHKLVDKVISQTKAHCLNQIGNSYRNLGSVEKSIDYYQQALQFSCETEDRHGESTALGNLGIAYYHLGQYQRAIDSQKQRLNLAQEIDDRLGVSAALGNLGLVAKNLGNYESAINYYQEALSINLEIGNREGKGDLLGNLGVAHYNLGQYQQAIDYHEQHLAIAEELGDRRGKGNALGNLGIACYMLGQYERAISYQEQHLELAKEIGDRQGEGNSLDNLGLIYSRQGDHEKAIDKHQQALFISREIGDRSGAGESLSNLGVAHGLLEQYDKAIDIFQERLTLALEIGDRRGEGYALGNLGSTYGLLGQYEQAINYHQQALVISREIDDRNGEGLDLHNLGFAQIKVKQYPEALENLSVALEIFREIGTRNEEAEALRVLAELHQALGEIEVAQQFCQQALELATELGIPLQEDCQKLKEELENGE